MAQPVDKVAAMKKKFKGLSMLAGAIAGAVTPEPGADAAAMPTEDIAANSFDLPAGGDFGDGLAVGSKGDFANFEGDNGLAEGGGSFNQNAPSGSMSSNGAPRIPMSKSPTLWQQLVHPQSSSAVMNNNMRAMIDNANNATRFSLAGLQNKNALEQINARAAAEVQSKKDYQDYLDTTSTPRQNQNAIQLDTAKQKLEVLKSLGLPASEENLSWATTSYSPQHQGTILDEDSMKAATAREVTSKSNIRNAMLDTEPGYNAFQKGAYAEFQAPYEKQMNERATRESTQAGTTKTQLETDRLRDMPFNIGDVIMDAPGATAVSKRPYYLQQKAQPAAVSMNPSTGEIINTAAQPPALVPNAPVAVGKINPNPTVSQVPPTNPNNAVASPAAPQAQPPRGVMSKGGNLNQILQMNTNGINLNPDDIDALIQQLLQGRRQTVYP